MLLDHAASFSSLSLGARNLAADRMHKYLHRADRVLALLEALSRHTDDPVVGTLLYSAQELKKSRREVEKGDHSSVWRRSSVLVCMNLDEFKVTTGKLVRLLLDDDPRIDKRVVQNIVAMIEHV